MPIGKKFEIHQWRQNSILLLPKISVEEVNGMKMIQDLSNNGTGMDIWSMPTMTQLNSAKNPAWTFRRDTRFPTLKNSKENFKLYQKHPYGK